MILAPVPSELLKFIDKHQMFFLISHIDPDGDCIASSLALGQCLQKLGKEAHYLNPGPFKKMEVQDFKKYFSSIPEDIHLNDSSTQSRAVIIIDCSSADRIVPFAEHITKLPIAVIDHHSSAKNYGDVRFINSSSPATSLLIQQLIRELGVSMNHDMAELIFFAFATDTGFFRYLGKEDGPTLILLSELVECGVSPKKIHHMISGSVSLASRQYIGKLMNRTKSYYNGAFLFTWSTYDDIKLLEGKDRRSNDLYQQLMNVQGVEILLVLWEKQPDITVGNIRTSARIDAGKLAAEYGGGGHARAAGFETSMSIEETFTDVLKKISGFF